MGGLIGNLRGNIFITGGAGYLARGIYRRARAEKWDARFTCFSRDSHKHVQLAQEFPEVRCLQGDIAGDLDLLTHAMAGHDLVIHAAASKHVDMCEKNVWEAVRVNVFGSMNVAQAAVAARVGRVVGISTDKACKPVTVYGHTKAAMERLFLEANEWSSDTSFHVVRYGNVVSSTGSVLPTWKAMLARDGYVSATRPDMTRFWMSIDEAIDAITTSLIAPGSITIYKARALSMQKMREYLMPEAEFRYFGLRSIEKLDEELLAEEESPYAYQTEKYIVLQPTEAKQEHEWVGNVVMHYKSSLPDSWLTQDELQGMLA